ncbi:MAG: hypothetical protein HRU09_17080 [Oligoflexales bacterium]|nr:hypothetical protein [Oligoflexales bacterium]
MRNVIVLALLSLGNIIGVWHSAVANEDRAELKEANTDDLSFSFYRKDSLNFEQNVRRLVHEKKKPVLQKTSEGGVDVYKLPIKGSYFTSETGYEHAVIERGENSEPQVKLEIDYIYYTRKCVKRVHGPSPVQSHCVKWLNEPHSGVQVYDLDFSAVSPSPADEQVHLLIRRNSQWQKKPKLKNLAIVSHDASYKIKKKRFKSKLMITED